MKLFSLLFFAALSFLANASVGAQIAPVINSQPVDVQAMVDGDAYLYVEADGGGSPLSYTWYEGVSGDTSHPIADSNRALLRVLTSETKQYWVEVTNDGGSVSSNTMQVQIAESYFYGLGDLPGGDIYSEARDATLGGGMVVGNSIGEYGREPIIWTQATGLMKLPEANEDYFSSFITASDISSDGQYIGGRMYNANGNREAVIWKDLEVYRELGQLSQPDNSYNTALITMSDDATLGYGWGTFNNSQGNFVFKYTEAGGIESIGSLGGSDYTEQSLMVGGMSGDGAMLTGYSEELDPLDLYSTGAARSFIYTEAGGLREIPSPEEYNNLYAQCISRDGTVIGGYMYQEGGDEIPGFLWSPVSGVLSIGKPRTFTEFSPDSITDSGVCVGGARADYTLEDGSWEYGWYAYVLNNSGYFPLHAVLESAGLNLEGWTLNTAACNSDGTVLWGRGINPEGEEEGWMAVLPSSYLETSNLDDTAPVVLGYQLDQQICEGADLTLDTHVLGIDEMSYQWYHNGFEIHGATEPTYQKSDVADDDAGSYFCRIYSVDGSAYVDSNVSEITVIPSGLITVDVSLPDGSLADLTWTLDEEVWHENGETVVVGTGEQEIRFNINEHGFFQAPVTISVEEGVTYLFENPLQSVFYNHSSGSFFLAEDGRLVHNNACLHPDKRWLEVFEGGYAAIDQEGHLWSSLLNDEPELLDDQQEWLDFCTYSNEYGSIGYAALTREGELYVRNGEGDLVSAGSSMRFQDIAGGNNFLLMIDQNGNLYRTVYPLSAEGSIGWAYPVDSSHDCVKVFGKHTLSFGHVLKSDGYLWAIGQNDVDYLAGIGASAGSDYSLTEVEGDRTWKWVEYGDSVCLFVGEDNQVWATGDENLSELGTEGPVGEPYLLDIETDGLSGISQDGPLVYSLDGDYQLQQWIGSGSSMVTDSKSVPVAVFPEMQWKSACISSGEAFGVAEDGTLWAWGYAWCGESWDGEAPVRVGSKADWIEVSVTPYYSRCVFLRDANGQLFSMARNELGVLVSGRAEASIDEREPHVVGNAFTVTSLPSVGNTRAYILDDEGQLWVWGQGQRGLLDPLSEGDSGFGEIVTVETPRLASPTSVFDQVAASYYSTVGLSADGDIYAWGEYWNGLVVPYDSDFWTLEKGGLHLRDPDSPAATIAAGTRAVLAITDDGSITGFGASAPAEDLLLAPVAADNDWAEVYMMPDYSDMAYGLKEDGSLWTWAGTRYLSGIGYRGIANELTRVWIDGKVKAFSINGVYGSCAITEAGELWAWGANEGNVLALKDQSSSDQNGVILADLGQGKVSVRVFVTPDEALADGVQWRVSGSDWMDSGATFRDAVSGLLDLEFKVSGDWMPLDMETLDTRGNRSIRISRSLTPLPLPVDIPDDKLREHLVEFLEDEDGIITRADLYGMTGTLDLSEQGIESLAGLEYAPRLNSVVVRGNDNLDLSEGSESSGIVSSLDGAGVLIVHTEDRAGAWLAERVSEETPDLELNLMADTDGDGISNLMEYAMNLDPSEDDTEEDVGIEDDEVVDDPEMGIRARVDDPALHFYCEVSNNLKDWTRIALTYDSESKEWSVSDASIEVYSATEMDDGTWQLKLKDTTGFKPLFMRVLVQYLP